MIISIPKFSPLPLPTEDNSLSIFSILTIIYTTISKYVVYCISIHFPVCLQTWDVLKDLFCNQVMAFKIQFLVLFYVYECLNVCKCTHVVHCPQRSEEGVGTGVTDTCQLPCGCWESNPGSLQEQSMLLTTEPSLQPQYGF